MNLVEVKERLYDITDMFFKGASLLWTEQITTKPTVPYITLKCKGINRSSFPVSDDEGNKVYSCGTILEVNLYTKGKPVSPGRSNVTGNYINTAMSDMMDFANFVESSDVTDVIAGYGMDVSLMPPVRDLTELQNESNYRYRSMAEFSVTFTEDANGAYGVSDMPIVPNSSGGGTADMAAAETAIIDEVVITEGGTSDAE